MLELEDGYKILIDCGTNLDTQDKFDKREQNSFGLFPFDASLVNTVVLTHAHIDHSGQIPNLYREGFEGQVLCTNPTMELTELLLHDAASINAKKHKSIQKSKRRSKKLKSLIMAQIERWRQA